MNTDSRTGDLSCFLKDMIRREKLLIKAGQFSLNIQKKLIYYSIVSLLIILDEDDIP